MSAPLTIVVADDHPMLLKGVADELSTNGYNVLATSLNGAQALDYIVDLQPAIAILDIEMPLLSGFEVIAKATEKQVNTRFIILTSHKEKGFVMKARKFNISGYVLKDEPFSELDACIKSVAEGREYFSTTFDAIVQKEISPALRKINFLSPSERTIVRLIAQGKSSKEIGDMLFISHRTVQKHRGNIIAKLNLSSTTDALSVWAEENKELILML